MSTYIGSLTDISELQMNIMVFITDWCRKQKTPVPQREIILQMKADGVKDLTTLNALYGLLRKGYITKSVMTRKTTSYIQLRTVSV